MYSYVSVCSVCYSYVTRMLPVCTRVGIGIGIGLLKIHIAASKAELHEITV